MPSMNGKSGKQYWRSLNDLADKPEFREFVQREFPEQASEWLGGTESRRTFLKIMGASMALAGLASCRRWPDELLAPYAHRPANRMDGVPVHYATAFERAGMGHGVVAVSFDGRPIKVDGNPLHPLTGGRSDIFLQASVLNVYDPDRSREVVERRGDSHGMQRAESSWERVAESVKQAGAANGAGMVILTEASRSPSVAAMRRKLPQAKWFEYEVVSNDHQRAGAQMVSGRPLRAVPALDQAAVIVSIDADLFHGEPLAIKYNRDFAAGRMLRDNAKASSAEMNRLYVIESGFTITGSMADHRRGVKGSEVAPAVAALAAALGVGQAPELGDKELQEFVTALAKDIRGLKGKKAVIVAGFRQPPEVHAAVAAMNAALQAPVTYFAEAEDPRAEGGWTPHSQQIKAFAEAAKGATAVVVLGANPVLTAPAELGIEEILKNAKLSIHAGMYEDETAKVCQFHMPMAHYLEAWGDVRASDGTVSITQPLIMPLFGARSTIEILSLLAGKEEAGYDIVRGVAKAEYLKNFSDWNWKKALFDGVIANTGWAPVPFVVNPANVGNAIVAVAKAAAATQSKGGLELALTVGNVHDGRYVNNAWLQELPDPMTRVVWENPAIVSPATAKELGVDSDDVVTLTTAAGSIEAVMYVLPGQPDGVLSLPVGYGRLGIGSVAQMTENRKEVAIGTNAYALKGANDGAFISVTKFEKYGDRRAIVASVQDHHTIDPVGKNRLKTIVPELVVEGVLEQYRKNPKMGARKIVALSMFDERSYNPDDPWVQAKWGMAVDLTTCTGCSACVVACQAENNIPVVGKEQVYRGREMHWLRIDRYFKWGKGSAEDLTEQGTPQVVHQPVMCMHCENAPCEEVCPVAATTHSHEGLNMMTYNRCIGTRYCSNNCPYKVRRFNFFDYNSGTVSNLYTPNIIRDDLNELVKMQKNPQVTVRSRGVMEKCTYCVQRIENARIELRAENRTKANDARFKDGAVVTACQQACPTDAIVFGDLNDAEAKVTKLHKLAQVYGMLDADLNTKPRTQYLAKVRNPVNGLDERLYNEFTASEGFFWEETKEGAGHGEGAKPEAAGHGSHAP